MTGLIGICDNHGPFFSRVINLAGLTVQTSNIKVSCPACGRDSRVPDGLYTLVGDTVSFIAASGRSPKELAALHHDLLQILERGDASEDQVASTLDRHFPEHPGLRRFLPKDASTLRDWIKTICPVLALIISAYALWGNKQLTEQEINALIAKAVTQQQAAATPSAPSAQPRNRAERRARGRPVRPKRHK